MEIITDLIDNDQVIQSMDEETRDKLQDTGRDIKENHSKYE